MNLTRIMDLLAEGRQPRVRQCAWCRRVWDESSETWVEARPVPWELVTHGMCKACEAAQVLEAGA